MQALTALATSDEHTGRRYGTHLFTSLTSVRFHNINCVNGKEAATSWSGTSRRPQVQTVFCTSPFTAEEYNSLNGDYTGLQANMRRPFCEHMIYKTSPFDALTTLAYLFRPQDLPTQCPRHLHGPTVWLGTTTPWSA